MNLLGIEIGKSLLTAGIINAEGYCYEQIQVSVQPSVATQLDHALQILRSKAAQLWPSLAAVGISDVQHYLRTDLANSMSQQLGIPVFHTHTGNAAALAEKHFGQGKGFTDFLAISLENDVQCGIVTGGALAKGEHGGAGQLGQMQVSFHGQYDRLLEHLSEEGIRKATFRAMMEYPQLASPLRGESFNSLTAAQVAKAAHQKDKLALQVFEQLGALLGLKLSDVIAYFSPQAIIIACSTLHLGDLLLHPTSVHTQKNAMAIFQGKTQILLSELPADAACVLRGMAVAFEAQLTSAVSA